MTTLPFTCRPAWSFDCGADLLNRELRQYAAQSPNRPTAGSNRRSSTRSLSHVDSDGSTSAVRGLVAGDRPWVFRPRTALSRAA
jgi:hypothetical protein